jgi:hypothetical protein
MARLISTTVRLEREDVLALKRARETGLSASDLLRKGLRVVASRYLFGTAATLDAFVRIHEYEAW